MAEKKIEQKPAKKRRSVRVRYVYGAAPVPYSLPTLTRAVTLKTVPAQMAYEEVFNMFSSRSQSLFALVPIAVQHKEDVAFVNGLVDKMVGGVRDEIRVEIARIKKIAEDNGIGIERLNYSNPMVYSATITGGKAGVYLQAILELDELICLVHAAWFACFVSSDEKVALEKKWRDKLETVARKTREISDRAFIPALIAAFRAEYNRQAGEAANPSAAKSGEGASEDAAKQKRGKKATVAAAAAHQPVEGVAAL